METFSSLVQTFVSNNLRDSKASVKRASKVLLLMFRHYEATISLLLLLVTFLTLFSRESVAGLRSFLLEQTAAGGDKAVLQYVTNMLNGSVGFLFNERFINIPAQVSVSVVSVEVSNVLRADHSSSAGDAGHGDEEGKGQEPALRLQSLCHDIQIVQNEDGDRPRSSGRR